MANDGFSRYPNDDTCRFGPFHVSSYVRDFSTRVLDLIRSQSKYPPINSLGPRYDFRPCNIRWLSNVKISPGKKNGNARVTLGPGECGKRSPRRPTTLPSSSRGRALACVPGFILKVLIMFSSYAMSANRSIASYHAWTLSVDTGNFESLWCSLKLILLIRPQLSSLQNVENTNTMDNQMCARCRIQKCGGPRARFMYILITSDNKIKI